MYDYGIYSLVKALKIETSGIPTDNNAIVKLSLTIIERFNIENVKYDFTPSY